MRPSIVIRILILVVSLSFCCHRPVFAKTPATTKGSKAHEKVRPKPKGPIRITAQSVRAERKKLVSYFEGNVVVKSPQYTLAADKVTTYFDDQNSIVKIYAKGNVKLTSGKRVGTAREATYLEVEGIITLTGNAKINDPYEGSMTSQEIIYYLDDERVVAKGKQSEPTIIIYGLDGKNDQKSHGK